jgi:hypothetical protein
MRQLIFGCIFWMCATASLHAATDSPNPLIPLAFAQYKNVQILGADTEDDNQFSWISWSHRIGGESSVTLMLLQNAPSGPLTVLNEQVKDAYEPNITRVDKWRYNGHPVLVLTYQQGAAAVETLLYGIDRNQRPIRLETRLAERITWRDSPMGTPQLGLSTRPGDKMQVQWLQWNDKPPYLTPVNTAPTNKNTRSK